jgi:ornithine cyclodeaminase
VTAVCAVRPITEIRIFSLSGVDQMAEALRGQYQYRARVVVAPSAPAALEEAHVVAATNSKTPVVHLDDLAPGTHINGIGSFTPEMQKSAADVVMAARVVVDHRASVWAEAGDLIVPFE